MGLFDLAPQETKPLEITVTPRDRPTNAPKPAFDLAPGDDRTSAPVTGKALNNAPDDEDYGGLRGAGKNIASSVLTGMSTLAGGIEGDTVEAARRLAAGVRSLHGDRTTQQILDEWNTARDKANQEKIEQVRTMQKPSWSKMSDELWERGRQRRLDALQINHGAPASTEDVYKHNVAPKVGTYTPTSRWGEYGHAAIAGAVPGLAGGPLGVVAGGVGGITSQAMSDSGANPFWATAVPLGVGAVTPYAAKGASATRRGVFGKNTAEQQAAADKLLAEQTGDPVEAARLARERTGMPDETLAESTVRNDQGVPTGDRGLAKAQDTLLTQGQPDMVAAAQRLQAERQGAMTGTLGKIAPDSRPEDVSANVQQHLEQINAAADAAPQPSAPTTEVAGANLRGAGQGRRDTVMEALDTLKKSVDPEGRMGAWTGHLNDFAATKLQESETRPLKGKMSDVAQEYFDTAAKLKDVTKFNDLIDFDQSITQGLKKTRDVDPAGYAALGELKGQVKNAINKSLENQHKWDQVQVQDGTLNPEDVLAARFQRQRDEWLARKQVGEGPMHTEGAGSVDTVPEGSVSSVSGADQGRSGPGSVGESGSVPGSAPLEPVSGDAATRLSLFNEGYGKAKDTFDKGDVGKALDTEFGGQSKMKAAEVAQKAFTPGPKGFETANLWLAAGGPEGLAALKDIAIGRLQAELKGKPLDQKALDTWKTKHADALRAIDDADAKANPGQNSRFTDQFNDTAASRQAVQAFENSAAAEFLGKQPGDIVNHVSSLLKAKDSTPLRDLMRQVDSLPNGEAIKAGLQRAGAQWLQDNFEASGIRNIRNLIAEHSEALNALFDKDAVSTMEKVSDSIDRSATVQALGRRTVGSPTGERATGIANLDAQLKATVAKDGHSGALEMGGALAAIEMAKELGTGVITGDVHRIAQGAIGLTSVLVIKPLLERALAKRGAKTEANITRLLGQGFASRDVGLAMLERAIDERGRPNQLAIDTLADAIIGAETSTQEKRPEHAAGGSVFDHTKAARHMVDLVDKARKHDSEITKPLLQAHDNTIARALAIANQRI